MAFAISVSNALGFAHMTAIDRIKPFAEATTTFMLSSIRRGAAETSSSGAEDSGSRSSVMSSLWVRCFLSTSGLCRARTRADGDALDVLVLSDEPLFPLYLVEARLIGVIEAEQTQEGKLSGTTAWLP
jgi:Inorganic pyrophosphatase